MTPTTDDTATDTDRVHDHEDDAKDGQAILELTDEEELELLAGYHPDDISRETDALAEFGDRLMGYKLNSDREIAWIRAIVPPGETVPNRAPIGVRRKVQRHDLDSDIPTTAIEFLLPSTDTFWESFTISNNQWDESDEFAQLLSNHGVSPGEPSDLLGCKVDITYRSDCHYSGWTVNPGDDEPSDEEKAEAREDWFNTTDTHVTNLGLVAVVTGPLLFLFNSLVQYLLFNSLVPSHILIQAMTAIMAAIILMCIAGGTYEQFNRAKNENLQLWSDDLGKKNE